MNIHFYLNDEEETPITSMYDLKSNPFSVGDIVHLNVEELVPMDYNKYKPKFANKMIEDNEGLESKFGRKKVKLLEEGKYIRFKIMEEAKLTIEYHCEIIED
jgi:hypothetical protein